MEKFLVVEDRFGYIHSKVPKIFKPKLIIKNCASQAVEFLKRCKNPKNFPLPPSEPSVPQFENYTLNVFFRLFYTNLESFEGNYTLKDFQILEGPLVEFEMQFLAGKVPFADYSKVYLYKLEEER